MSSMEEEIETLYNYLFEKNSRTHLFNSSDRIIKRGLCIGFLLID